MASIDITLSDSDMDLIRSGEAIATFIFSGKKPKDSVDISLLNIDIDDPYDKEMLKQTLLKFIEKLDQIIE